MSALGILKCQNCGCCIFAASGYHSTVVRTFHPDLTSRTISAVSPKRPAIALELFSYPSSPLNCQACPQYSNLDRTVSVVLVR